MLSPLPFFAPARFDALAERVVIRVPRTHDDGGASASPWTSLEVRSSSVEVPANASAAIEPGAAIGGKYTLLRQAGMGGMGVVWVARNEATGGEVAVKFLLPRAEWTPARLERLRSEARVTASLSHRGIVRLFDLVETARGPLLLVMEMLHGHTLADEIDAKGPLPAVEAARIALDLLSALAHVHGSGIVHRDIKPSNVFLAMDPDGFVTTKLLDFGVSKARFDGADLTARGEVLGTPRYMSPEQAGGCEVDARSDVFSMGILLYEMLSGRNPFAGTGGHALSAAVRSEEVARIVGVPQALWDVLVRALRRDPEQRFASAGAMAEALRAAVIHRLQIAPRSRVRYIAALVAASLFAVTAFSFADSQDAASASRAQPRVKAQRTARTMEPSVCARIAFASPPAPQPQARPAPAPARASILLDPGF